MDHGYSMASWGAATFWIFIGIAAWASHWERTRRNAEKHETLRRIIEKTGTVDEARLRELFHPATSDWLSSRPGSEYRGLMMGGTIMLAIAIGVALFFFVLGRSDIIPQKAMIIGIAAAGILVTTAVGLFVATRFVDQPGGPDSRRLDR